MLAYLHAGNLPPAQADAVWQRVLSDAAARRYLDDLDQVSAALRRLGQDEDIVHPIPAPVTARLDRLLRVLSERG